MHVCILTNGVSLCMLVGQEQCYKYRASYLKADWNNICTFFKEIQ